MGLIFKVVQTAETATIAAPAISELCAEACGNIQQQLYEVETEILFIYRCGDWRTERPSLTYPSSHSQ